VITLITGVPGTGKSAWLVKRLSSFPDWRDRRVYVDGIPDLNQDAIPHFTLPFVGTLRVYQMDGHKPVLDVYQNRIQIGETTGQCTFQNWPDWCMPEDLIVVDECQKHVRSRPSGSFVPIYVTEMETHRSRYGVDLVLSTQKTSIIDANVKAQVGQHYHIREGWFGRYIYEWGEVSNGDSRTDRAAGTRQKYRLPKDIFKLYTSAPVHNKKTRSKPLMVYVLPFLVLGFIFLLWRSYASIHAQIHPDLVAAKGAPSSSSGSIVSSNPALSTSSHRQSNRLDYVPLVPNRPETAPLYDDVRKVVSFPRPVAAVCNAEICICFSQQGTRLDIDTALCRRYASYGFDFDPYVDDHPVDDFRNVQQSVQQPLQQPQQLPQVQGQSDPAQLVPAPVPALPLPIFAPSKVSLAPRNG
jgi:zona occludens toxin